MGAAGSQNDVNQHQETSNTQVEDDALGKLEEGSATRTINTDHSMYSSQTTFLIRINHLISLLSGVYKNN